MRTVSETTAAGDEKDRYFRRKNSKRKGIYIIFLESKQVCCLNLDSYCLVEKKKCLFLSFSKQVASFKKNANMCGLQVRNYDKN